MLKILIKNRISALLYSLFNTGRRGRQRTKLASAGLFILLLYAAAAFIMLFGMIFSQICQPFHAAGLDWFYFAFTAILAFALMFIGSVFATHSQLYEAKDNELLLSMPIPPRAILLSRMISLLLLNFIFDLIVAIPAGFVYFTSLQADVSSLFFFILVFLFLPLLSLAVSSAFAWLISRISARIRNKSLFVTLFSFLFLGAYFYFYSQMNNYVQLLILNSSSSASKVRAFAAPVYWLGTAIADSNVQYLLLGLLCVIVPFIVVFLILSNTFIKTVTVKHGAAKVVYREKPLKVSSPQKALLQKELRQFLSCPTYILNASLGIVFIFIGGVFLLIKSDLVLQFVSIIPDSSGLIPAIITLFLCGMATLNNITAPSISLEGKRLWIIKSIPVSPLDILTSKLKLHLFLCIPPILFTAVISVFIFSSSAVNAVCMIFLPIMVTIFCALLGLIANLKFPRFDWISETAAVKQGASVLIAIFGSMGAVLLPVIIYFFLPASFSLDVYLLSCLVVFTLACALLYRWLTVRGVKVFESL